jgi:hypothetical protein
METYTFPKSGYSQVSQSQEHLEELENGEIDMLEYEQRDLIDDGGILIESKRRARATCVRRLLIGVLVTAVVMTLFAVGMVVGRNIYAEKTASAIGSRLKHDVDTLCTPDAISKMQGLSKCKDICTVASCCHAPENGEEENCFNLFPDFCEDYLSCNILQQGPDIPTLVALDSHEGQNEASEAQDVQENNASIPPSPVSEACRPELLDNPESKTICQDLCVSFTCCFVPDPNTGVTCYDSNPSCSGWGAPCGNLFNTVVTQDSASTESLESTTTSGLKETIDLACDFSRFPDTRAECDELCDPAECCFESPNHCTLSADQCGTTYSSCKVLYDDFFEEPGASDKFYFNGGVYFAAQVERDVYDRCIASDITIQEQRRACETACEPAACCFIEEGETSCKGERICESFVQCSILKEQAVSDLDLNQNNVAPDPDSALDQSPLNQDSTVTDQSTSTELGHFDEPQVPDDGEVVIINGVATQQQEIKSRITTDCVEKDLSVRENLAACMITCEPSVCCFIEGQDSCKGARFCDFFAECEVFLTVVPNSESQLSDEGHDAGVVVADQTNSGNQEAVVDQNNNPDGDSQSVPSDVTMEEVSVESQIVDSNGVTNTDQGEGVDQYNTSLLLNALNEVESSQVDTVPEKSTNQDAVLTTDVAQDTSTTDMLSTGDTSITEASVEAVSDQSSPSDQGMGEEQPPTASGNEGDVSTVQTGEPNEQALNSEDETISSTASVVQEGSEQSSSGDQDTVVEEFFIEGEKYTKEELTQKLQAVCTDLSSDVNRKACLALCEPAECCNEDGTNSCKGDTFCDAFTSCSVLMKEAGQSDEADGGKVFIVDGRKYTEKEMERNVHNICSLKDLSIEANRQACADLCRHGKCCFQSGEKSCKGDTFCNAFEDCEELIL